MVNRVLTFDRWLIYKLSSVLVVCALFTSLHMEFLLANYLKVSSQFVKYSLLNHDLYTLIS